MGFSVESEESIAVISREYHNTIYLRVLRLQEAVKTMLPLHPPSAWQICLLVVCFIGSASLNLALADESQEGRFFGAKDTEYPAWFKQSFLDLPEDIAEARDENKRLMLIFHQDGCPYCNALVERNLSQKQIESKIQSNFEVIAINLWGDREVIGLDHQSYTEKSFASSLGIQFTPTILFLDEEANVTLRLNGYRSPYQFELDLEYVINRIYEKQSFREFLNLQNTRTQISTQLRTHPDFLTPPFDLSSDERSAQAFAVIFEQRDCPNCEYIHNKVLVDPELTKAMSAFYLYQVDMWSSSMLTVPDGRTLSSREWADELGIQYAPSIVFFSSDGKELIRLEAFFKYFHTLGVFNYVATGAYQTEPSFQRYLSLFADQVRAEGHDVNIWDGELEINPEGKFQ